jgi:hypothetical protein
MSGTGDCFRWALWDAVNNGGTLVHGWSHHPDTGTYAHAWVERDGMVYDWQRCDQNLGPCPQPLDEFDAEFLPEHEERYPGNGRLIGRAAKEGSYGPWHSDPWSDPTWTPRTNSLRRNPWYDDLLTGDLYRGTTTTSIGGSNLGYLGAGVYLTWKKGVAEGFARIAADKQGGEPLIQDYRILAGLNFLDRDSPEWAEIMRELGVEPWDNIGGSVFSNILTQKVRDIGYDGVISKDPYDGLVVFDSQNVIGYVDSAVCENCGERKLSCERCGHWWCAFGCEDQYEDCPECSICKQCGEDDLDECYECKTTWCADCDGRECPKGCD